MLLAYELDGAPLAPEHGYPVRLVVPGYYGTNSVKWLWRLHLADRRPEGLFTTRLYTDAAGASARAAGSPEHRPVWAIAPESIIVSPAPDAVLRRGATTEVWGWAWSFAGVASAEVSVNGGESYQPAALEARRGWSWQRFSFPWSPTERGEFVLSVRAQEAGGMGQPNDGARNAIHRVPISVE